MKKEKIIQKMDQSESKRIKITYKSDVKLTKKNRETKMKLTEEYPEIEKVVKISKAVVSYGKSYGELLEEFKRPEPKVITEEVKKEKAPIYEYSKYLVKHIKTGTEYIEGETISSDSNYEFHYKTGIVVDDKDFNPIDLENFKVNYFPTDRKVDNELVMEKQWTTKPITLVKYKIDNIVELEIEA